ncbi:MAG TPA: aminotransferase class V-fold PLP-dependent enzyme [Longimicrobiales bacterium]
MDPDLERWRADTPGVASGRIHLNNAGASLQPRPVLDAVRAHLELEARIGGYEAADAAAAEIAAAYGSVARLVGGAPRNIAMVENATAAFFQALAAFDFARGDVILTTRNDYISNQLAYLSLQRRVGVRVVRAADLPEGGVDPESVRALIRRERPKLVALTWVPTNSGLVQPAEAVGAVCEEEGVPYVVDACQAVGQLPIDVGKLRCDFLSATARKFLRGPRGAGFLWVSDRALDRGAYPLLVDMRGAAWVESDEFRLAPDARRFENWEFAYGLVLGQGAAARYALDEVGVERGGERAARLAAYARDRLREHDGLRVLDRGPRLCAIVTVEVAGRSAFELVPLLREQGINTSATARDYAVLDMDDKRARTALRISPHYYNTEAEIDAAVAAIAALAQPAG